MQALDPETLVLAGSAVVEASAGTGKTYTITSLFVRLLLESELSVDQILVVTYTRAATAELRDRIRKRVAAALALAKGDPVEDPLLARLCRRAADQGGEEALIERLERALAGVDEAPVLTIHGFCQRVLRDHAFESGAAFESQLLAHATPLLDEIADDYFMRELYAAPAARASALLDEPAMLRQLAARVGGRELRVVPAECQPVEHDEAAFQAALVRCRELWRRERGAVSELVRALKGVGNKVEGYAETVEQALRDGAPASFLSKAGFSYFTRSCVQEKSKGVPPEHPFFEEADALLEHARAHAAAKKSMELGFRRGFVDFVQHELDRRARESRVRTFDALLSDLDRALESAQGPQLVERLRKKYRAALVDEFQDTDPLQYRIFRRIFASGQDLPLLLIGDPKQAIYGFRGADVAAYLAARAEAGERVYTLDVNWRSDASLLDALNAMYRRVTRPFLLPEIDYHPVRASSQGERLRSHDGRAALDLALLPDVETSSPALSRQIASAVASDIAQLLGSQPTRLDGQGWRPLRAADIAVLTRTNKQAAEVQQALSERKLPSVLSGDASVLDSDDVPQLERALHALAHPGDARALRAFLCSIYGGHDASAIRKLEDDDAKWDEHRTRFARLHALWLSHGFVQALRGLTEAYGIETRLLARPDGTRRVTNLWHLVELLAEASVSQRLGPLGLLRWLSLVRQDQAMRAELVGDAHELRLESSEDAITLTTIHKSKGLEYPIVYCPFSWTAAELFSNDKQLPRFHDPAADQALTLDLEADPQNVRLAQREALEEALRILYVALTRAKHRVTVLLPNAKALAKSGLAYTLFGGGDAEAVVTQVEALIAGGGLSAELARAFSLRTLVDQPAAVYAPRQPALGAGARVVRRTLDTDYRVASFSALIAKERTVFGEAGLDRDAEHEHGPAEPHDAPSTLILGEFPRGTVAGQLIHEVLEHAEFDGDDDALDALVVKYLGERGFAPGLSGSLTRGLRQMLATPLDAHGLCLQALDRRARIDEMEFVFPVDRKLTPFALAEAFRKHRAPSAAPGYVAYLKELGFQALHGYLRGFIDLVFRYQGRFYVVDYKSNWLGPRAEDYGADQLADAMAHHHYYLQYHLYTVAVHRYLAQRLPGYEYGRDFGGVYYLFLRGMAKEHAPGTGVFHDKPPPALITELDRLLRRADKEAR